MKNPESDSANSLEPVLPRSHRLVRRLVLLYGICALAVAAVLAAALLPAQIIPQTRLIAFEAISGGLGAMVLAALLLALTGLLGALALTSTRYRNAQADVVSGSAAGSKLRPQEDPGFAARQGQAFIVPLGAILIWVAVRVLWPAGAAAGDATTPNIAAAFVFALAFVSLVAERVINGFPEPQLPEAPSLRRLLLLTTVILVAAAAIELGRGAALAWLRWPEIVLAIVPGLVVSELAVRALARLFLPAPATADAKAVTDSILATVITGGPRAPGTLLRTHLGLDFARSWALQFLSAAIPAALFATALLCWALTGLKLIELGQRGVYERFGAPVAVMGPGLHLLLPWPLGRLRPVEFGTIHSVAIGVDQTEPDARTVDAEATPPAALNRLWESAHPGQAEYLVPSRGTGSQGFQSVSTEISVLYRVGLTDTAAMQSIYTVADPESLIKESASRLVLRYFNSRELEAVLGARRENVAGTLREALAADMDSDHTGVEIVSVLIEEIHPPAGAAAAYHAVQAAQINASASISDELGRAKRTAGIAQQEAHQLTAAADAKASETTHAADAESYRFGADRRAYGEGGQAFLLERSFNRLKAALIQTPLIIVDHRLSPAQGPILDLRESGSGSRQGGAIMPAPAAAPAGGAAQRGPATGAAQRSFTPEVEDSN